MKEKNDMGETENKAFIKLGELEYFPQIKILAIQLSINN